MIRYLTAGESHGPELTGIIEGIPAGLSVEEDMIALQLARRQKGYGRGGRMAFEKDRAEILSGVRFGITMGGPIALRLVNRAHQKDEAEWPKVMAKSGSGRDIERITVPRPGHADLAGVQKYAFNDIRPVIERSSARETGMRVACCTIARQLLREFGIQIGGHVLRIGSVGDEDWHKARTLTEPFLEKGAESISNEADRSEVRCLNTSLSAEMVDEIKKCRKDGSSLGGIYEIIVTGLPAGLGSYVHWDRRLEAQLAQAVMGTQAMKGVEIGMGFEAARRDGQQVHDEITWNGSAYNRRTNRAGGIEGGMSTGLPVILRGAMKPIPTMLKPLNTVDIDSHEVQETRYERSDVCALPRAIVVIENIIAPVLANAFLEKYGGDSIPEIKRHYECSSP